MAKMSDNEQQNLQNKNDLLSQMDRLISSKLNAFEQRMESTQRNLSQSQISAIQEKLSASDNFTFRKKGNEEQFKDILPYWLPCSLENMPISEHTSI